MPSVPTMTALKTIKGLADEIINLQEHTSGRDTGGGQFRFIGGSEDDNGVYANGWLRTEYQESSVHPEWWGAANDGADCSTALNQAATFCRNKSTGIVQKGREVIYVIKAEFGLKPIRNECPRSPPP